MALSLVRSFWRVAVVGALAVVACGGGDDATVSKAPEGAAGDAGAGPAVAIEQFEFQPGEVKVAAGTTVTWTNEDTVAHTVQDEGELFPESDDLAKGQTFSFTYETPGSYPYICGIHPYMKGTVTVS